MRLEQQHDENLAEISIQLLRLQVIQIYQIIVFHKLKWVCGVYIRIPTVKIPTIIIPTVSEQFHNPYKNIKIPTDSFKIPTHSIKIPTHSIKIPTENIKIPTDPIKIPTKRL